MKFTVFTIGRFQFQIVNKNIDYFIMNGKSTVLFMAKLLYIVKKYFLVSIKNVPILSRHFL